MRIQSSDSFATRPTEEMHEMPKYFLIYEGEDIGGLKNSIGSNVGF